MLVSFEEKTKIEELPVHFLTEGLKMLNKLVVEYDSYNDFETQERINSVLNKCLECKNFQIKKEALELIESLIYKYDVEFLDMVEKSNMPEFKSKIQNFLIERDKGKFDVKLINNLPEKCLSTFELDSEEL